MSSSAIQLEVIVTNPLQAVTKDPMCTVECQLEDIRDLQSRIESRVFFHPHRKQILCDDLASLVRSELLLTRRFDLTKQRRSRTSPVEWPSRAGLLSFPSCFDAVDIARTSAEVVAYSGNGFVVLTWNVVLTAGAPVSGCPPPIEMVYLPWEMMGSPSVVTIIRSRSFSWNSTCCDSPGLR